MEEEARAILRLALQGGHSAMILVDADVLSELMRPTPDKKVLDWMDGLARDDVGLTAISVAEALHGIGSLPEGKNKRALLDAAICRVSSAGLATRNTKDFEDTGVVLIDPWQA